MAVKPGGATDPASRIESLVASQERRFRAVFLRAVELVRDQNTLAQLAELLAQGRLEEALAGVDAAARLLGDQYGASLSEAARDTANFLSGALTATVSFDQTNTRAVTAIQENRLRLIREFTGEQRNVIRQAMIRGIERGLNPRDQARLFRDSVGLTSRQESAVARYRALLESAGTEADRSLEALDRKLRDRRFDGTVRRARREGRPLTADQVARMTGRYRDRYVRYRSEVIGRTEALRSAHQGSEEMYRQAFESGELDPSEVTRTWVTARDERVRESHRDLNGQQRGPDEPFDAQDGQLQYPGDPSAPASETVQCRCVLTTRLEPT